MRISVLSLTLLVCPLALLFAADDVVSGVSATVKSVDKGTKTVVVKTGKGVEQTFHFVGRTVAHGTTTGSKDAIDGVKEGDQVVVHYTEKGGVKTAEEVDHVGKDGLKTSVVAVRGIDRGAKTVGVKTADGAEETWHLTDRAAVDSGKGVAKGAKVTAYYTEEGGKKVVHFFKEN